MIKSALQILSDNKLHDLNKLRNPQRHRGLQHVSNIRNWRLNRDVFCKGYGYWEKADLSQGYWNRKRKMWVATHFSEIDKQP